MDDQHARSTTHRLRRHLSKVSVSVAALGLGLVLVACAPSNPASDAGALQPATTTTAPAVPPAVPSEPPPTIAGTIESISVLYSLTAVEGSLTRVPGTAADYRLELGGTDRHTVWFADRPKRSSGTLPTDDLFTQWAALGMGDVPPNVALVVHDAPDHADTLVTVLRDPHFDAATGRFTATVTVLIDEHEPTGGTADHFADLHDGTLPPTFGAVSMFIDDMAATVADGCLVLPTSHCPSR